MQDLSVLDVFAEVSIGLLGFAGVVSALGWSRLPPSTKTFRVLALLLYGVASLAGSLFPLILSRFNLEIDSVWMVSAASLLGIQIGIFFYLTTLIWRLVQNEELSSSLALVVSGMSILAMVFVAYGILFAEPLLPAIYVVGVSASLSLGVFHFFKLVISIQSDGHDNSDA